MKWTYDGSIFKYPMKKGELWICGDSKVMINSLYDGLPEFMKEADCIFVDPPWNLGNENSFRTKADIEEKSKDFSLFLDKLFEGINEINPHTLYVEFSVKDIGEIERRIGNRYKFIDIYDVTYYKKHPCKILRASDHMPKMNFIGIDELDVIALICKNEEFNCIGDICMGRGNVGIQAFKNGRKFVGTELNPKRLAVMVNKIAEMGGEWTHE